MRVVVVDDEPLVLTGVIRALNERGVRANGYADSGRALREVLRSPPDAILLDWCMPPSSGEEFLRELRASRSNVPAVVMSGRLTRAGAKLVFDAGGDDVVAKPLDLDEVTARLRHAVDRGRRAGAPSNEQHVRVDTATRTVQIRLGDGSWRELDLKRLEFDLCASLVRREGVVEDDTLLDEVWGLNSPVQAHALEAAVSRLNRKLDGSAVTIQRSRGVGYRLTARNAK